MDNIPSNIQYLEQTVTELQTSGLLRIISLKEKQLFYQKIMYVIRDPTWDSDENLEKTAFSFNSHN